MADVTINQLSLGSPNKNSAVIPYSDGITTLKTSPSGIVAASPGSIIQVVFGTTSTAVNHTSTYADVISLPITIRGINSKVFIIINQHVFSDQDSGYGFRILRDTSTIFNAVSDSASIGVQVVGGAVNVLMSNYLNFQYLDSSTLTQNQTYTYKGQGRRSSGTRTVTSNYNSDRTSTITLMEIAG